MESQESSAVGNETNITAGVASAAYYKHANIPCLHPPHPGASGKQEITYFTQKHIHRVSLTFL